LELEQRYENEIAAGSADVSVTEELEWLKSDEALRLKQEAARNKRFPSEEIQWISRDGKKWIARSYRHQRRVLKYLVEQIATDTAQPVEQVYELFFKAHFTGNIREIAKLIEDVFDQGSFRVLGMMTGDASSANQMLNYLKKQRLKMDKDE